MERKCGNCLLRKQAGGTICPIFQEPVNDKDTACRKYIGHESPVCGFCGALMSGLPEVIVMGDGTTVLSCHNCGDAIGTCATCAQKTLCDFETNPIQIPKQVQEVIQQGNVRIQTMVRNLEREKETCMKNCPCWDNENRICLRQVGFCKAWRM